ncbi:hypothetical protein BVG16_09875 [Paenibacillus selenitireducens]|jgi:hypothetical protein|uniref:DUF4023 domain-containing protein n=1 Tax=Paenibacillus selenitireducens TaxID=1324314 RepID=A0A1T2XHN8_9BACL|nr:DUF4023 domain-containing protein [Paenibacillus selenitireducens]OPA79380.1 hypothetical protein BVG16_09875 [Paenibacillus selenitireducens]
MDNTHDFVQKVHDTQEKARKNKQHNGQGSPEKQLPGKQQHGTNK